MFNGLLKMWLAIEIEDFPSWFDWQQGCFELIQNNLQAIGVWTAAATANSPCTRLAPS